MLKFLLKQTSNDSSTSEKNEKNHDILIQNVVIHISQPTPIDLFPKFITFYLFTKWI